MKPGKPDLRLVPSEPPKDYEEPTPPDSTEPEYVVNVKVTGLEDTIPDTEDIARQSRGVFYVLWFLIGLLTGIVFF